MKQYSAEFIGTFALTFVVILSVAGSFPIPTPILAGLTLGLFVYTIGHISGAHINPAVTLALWFMGKIEQSKVAGYIIAQLAAGIAASMVARKFGMVPSVAAYDTASIAIAEGLGMFFFAFGIAAVVSGHVPSAINGIAVGGSLLLGIAIASLAGSSGILNPAVALGLHSMYTSYIVGPIAGAIAGMLAYNYLNTVKEEKRIIRKTR